MKPELIALLCRLALPELLLLWVVGPADSKTWVVDAAGGGDYTRITDACLAAASGDSVAIEPGSYDEYDGPDPYVFISGKSLSLIGLGASAEDVRARVSIYFAYSDPVLIRRITFHDEHTPVWCGVYSSMTVQECRFLDNNGRHQSGSGSAIMATGLRLTIEDCDFIGNHALGQNGLGEGYSGGAIYSEALPLTLRRCWFEENEATGNGGAVCTTGRDLIEDCTFVGNKAYNGAAVTAGDGLGLTGCTFYANETTWSQGACIEIGWELSEPIERCLVVGTINGYGMGCWGPASVYCFCFWGNERGSMVGNGCVFIPSYGNIEADPLFCDPATGNFRLQDGSPCLPGLHNGYDCGLIGAFGTGCVVEPVLETTWGRIKARFGNK